MNVELFAATESIDYVIIYVQATLQWTKVSFATLWSTFYYWFASDDQKCINYCTHCRKLKCIHYYSFNFRLFMFYYKSDSICKTITSYNTFIYFDTPLLYCLITNTVTQFLGGNLLRNLLCLLQMHNTMRIEQYSMHYLNVI